MIQYKRIDISKEVDFNKTKLSLECMICHYWYFKNVGFNGCHDFSMIIRNLSDFLILKIKDTISLLNKSVLNNKGVL